ncbi:MAG: DUF1211 domain-containing protein [Thermoplasmata archaeon]|nr:DUF1211 domain-containing protein [Thermoplasmata archaeon]
MATTIDPSGNPGEDAARPRPRIESLSDMVFGLALSVGALALVSSPPKNSGELYTDIATFAFSFLILIAVWLAYTRVMSVLPFENRRIVTLNSVLLFSVSIEPFLFNILKNTNLSSESVGYFGIVSQAYALDIAVMLGVLGLFDWTVATIKKPALADDIRKSFYREATMRWAAAGLFAISALPVFAEVMVYGQPLRILMWVFPLIFFRVGHRSPSNQISKPVAAWVPILRGRSSRSGSSTRNWTTDPLTGPLRSLLGRRLSGFPKLEPVPFGVVSPRELAGLGRFLMGVNPHPRTSKSYEQTLEVLHPIIDHHNLPAISEVIRVVGKHRPDRGTGRPAPRVPVPREDDPSKFFEF